MHLPSYLAENMWFLLLVVGIIGFPLAWVSDMVLGMTAFGVIVNYLFISLGGFGGALGTAMYVGSSMIFRAHPEYIFAGTIAGGLGVLILAVALKRVFYDA